MTKKKKLPILFHEARTGKLHSWQIWTEGADMVEEYGTVDGKKTTSRRTCKGKNIGKKNETTPVEQATKEAAAKHEKKLEKKYSLDPTAAKKVVFLPMLASDYRKIKKELKFSVDTQPKLDGNRCTAFWEDNELKLMTRGGKFWNVAHISAEVAKFLPPGSVLDGELYIHKMPLQDISALAKKHREVGDGEYPTGSIALEYWVYDGFHADCTSDPWWKRKHDLEKLFKKVKSKKIKMVETDTADNKTELKALLDEYEKRGFEGAIIRKEEGPYQLGHRSRDLLKWKKFLDKEFKIIGFKEAEGEDRGTVVWVCETKEENEFTVRPKGTRAQRRKWFENAKEYMGQKLTVKFQAWTKDKIPQFPVGINIREPGT